MPRLRERLNPPLEPFNFPFWAALLLLWAVIAGVDARTIYPACDASFWLCFLAAVARALVAMALAILAGSLTERRFGGRGETAVHAGFLLFTLCELAAAGIFALQGIALGQVLSDLRFDEPGKIWDMLKYTGFSPGLLAAGLLGFVLAAALGVLLLALSRRAASRRGWSVRLGTVAGAAGVALALVAGEQLVSRRVKNPAAWLREQRSMPLYAAAVATPEPLAVYSAQAAPFRPRGPAAASLAAATATAGPGDVVVLFVMESLRGSFITPEIAPNLDRFQRENMSFPRAYSNGNTTVLSWYALFHSDYPIDIHRLIALRDAAGSPALDLLKRDGFRDSVFDSGCLDYFGSRGIDFGKDDREVEFQKSAPGPSAPENDRAAVGELLDAIAAGRGKGRHLYVVFLNSTHMPYLWPADSPAPFQPIVPMPQDAAGNPFPAQVWARGELAARIRNRYKNSIRFVDGLFGEVVDRLKVMGAYRKAVIVVVGDHGEEFGEHGALTHGANLYDPQIRPAFIMKFPGVGPTTIPDPVSQVDVLPTLLDYFGGGKGPAPRLAGRSLLRPGNGGGAVLTMNDFEFVSLLRRFALITKDYKIIFDLTLGAGPGPLRVWEVLDARDRPVVPGRGAPADYRAFLDEEFAPRLDATGAVAISGPGR